MLKDNDYPVLAPSKVRAAGGKFRTLPDLPVCFQRLKYIRLQLAILI